MGGERLDTTDYAALRKDGSTFHAIVLCGSDCAWGQGRGLARDYPGYHLFPPDLWTVEVDAGQISQVVNNLILNADQAMPEGGMVRIRGENVHLGPVDHLPVKEGNYVRVSIEDEGIGIPPEYLGKIFDPYFTTKKKGSGHHGPDDPWGMGGSRPFER